jgi:hypothetical protein
MDNVDRDLAFALEVTTFVHRQCSLQDSTGVHCSGLCMLYAVFLLIT